MTSRIGKSLVKSLMATVLIAAAPVTAMADAWLKAESRHLVIYSENEEKMTRDYVRHMEAFNLAADTLFAVIGDSQLETAHKQTFYYMADLPEFKLVKPSIPDYAFSPELSCPDYGRSFFSVREQFNYDTIDHKFISADLAYLMRSYTGVKIAEYFSEPPPIWLTSGLQDYFMTMNIKKGDVILGLPLPDMLDDNGRHTSASAFYPIEDILTGTGGKARDGQVVRIQQWVIVSHLLANAEGRNKLIDYLERIRKGEDALTAFHTAIGLDDATVKAIYKRYIDKGVPYLIYHLDIATDAETTVTRLPAYGRDVPLMLASLRTCPGAKHGNTLLRDLRTLSARFPEDGLVSEATGLAEIDFGDPENARAAIDRRLAAAPKSVEALVQKARMTMKIGDAAGGDVRHARYAEARKLAGQAYRLDPGNAHVLYAFARASRDLPAYPDDNTLMAAELANNYANGSYRVYVAELYARRGRFDDALELLEPLAVMLTDEECRAAMARIVTALQTKAPAEELGALFEAYRGLP